MEAIEELGFIQCTIDRAVFMIGARGAATGLPAPYGQTTELELELDTYSIG